MSQDICCRCWEPVPHHDTFLLPPAVVDSQLITLYWLHLQRQLYHLSCKEAQGDAWSLLRLFSREIWCCTWCMRPRHGLLLKYIARNQSNGLSCSIIAVIVTYLMLFHQSRRPESVITHHVVKCYMSIILILFFYFFIFLIQVKLLW